MKYRFLTTVITGILILSCSSVNDSKSRVRFNSILLPEISDFTRAEKVKIYPADSLWNYIDGAADEYLSYRVVRVATVEYYRRNLTYSIDIYEFAEPLGAFGIYAKRRLPDDNFINLGTEALLGNGYLYCLKDRFFVTINSYGDELPDLESLRVFGTALDSLIPGKTDFPEQTFMFPQKRLVPHSEKFWPSGLEQFAAPESCFTADYKKGNDTCTLFYSSGRTQTEYETLLKVIQGKGRILSFSAGIGKNSIYAITDQTKKTLVGYTDGVIFGVLNVSGDLWAKALCEALLENLGVKV